MVDKELRKMNRTELIEIIYALQQNEKMLRRQVEELNRQLGDKLLHIENAGSIAEAAISLNHVFEDAESAARQYLESIQNQYTEAAQVLKEAREQADGMISSAQTEVDMAAERIRQTEDKCRALREQTTVECAALLEETEQEIERKRKSFIREAQAILKQYPELAAHMREDKKKNQSRQSDPSTDS